MKPEIDSRREDGMGAENDSLVSTYNYAERELLIHFHRPEC